MVNSFFTVESRNRPTFPSPSPSVHIPIKLFLKGLVNTHHYLLIHGRLHPWAIGSDWTYSDLYVNRTLFVFILIIPFLYPVCLSCYISS